MPNFSKLFCVFAVLSLCACGKKDDDDSSASPTEPQRRSQSEEKDNPTSKNTPANGQGTPAGELKTELAANTNILTDTNYITYGPRLAHSHLLIIVQVAKPSFSISKVLIDGAEIKQNSGASSLGDATQYASGTISKQVVDALVLSDRWNQEVIDREKQSKADFIRQFMGSPYFYVRGFSRESFSPPNHPELKIEVKEGAKAPVVLLKKF